jgi:DNA-binding NarL/FixJ family response regulator
MSIRIAIVEDDTEIRKMTASLLNFNADLECTNTFSSAEEFEEALPTLRADVVLMDIGLPGKSGIECIKNIRAAASNLNFMMFTTHYAAKEVFEALAVGATGYIVKGCNPEQLAESIREVHAGGSPMSREISRLVTASFLRTEPKFPELEKLTKQEREVLRGLEKGLAYKEIAALHFVSEHTVRSQVRRIYEKLEVHTRTEALIKVFGA